MAAWGDEKGHVRPPRRPHAARCIFKHGSRRDAGRLGGQESTQSEQNRSCVFLFFFFPHFSTFGRARWRRPRSTSALYCVDSDACSHFPLQRCRTWQPRSCFTNNSSTDSWRGFTDQKEPNEKILSGTNFYIN